MDNTINNAAPIQNAPAFNIQNQQATQNPQKTAADLQKPQAVQESVKPYEQKNLSREKLSESIQQLNDQLQKFNRDLQFIADEATGKRVVKVIDSNTGALIRQIPPEEILRIMQNIDNMSGLIFNNKA
ncbi:MAG: flagellar protein FlaG [Methylococcales bacterium]|jgi:flagellar protein FlaG|nr:flagellar protein FlaG [Methylococcaceae bacterium]HIL40135.1 flagellar protein FlaG [Methylococcales bacterium]